jgi:hypothetical protein
MKRTTLTGGLILLALLLSVFALAGCRRSARPDHPRGPMGSIILILRHAEKPDNGSGLSLAGEDRAGGYVNFFNQFTVDSKPLRLNNLFAAADSRESCRPRLTIEPLSRALGLPIDTRFKDKQVQALADTLQALPPGRQILICWHHGEIPPLLRALGGDPEKIVPGGRWPGKVYSWLIQLRYDEQGQLLDVRCINTSGLTGDADKTIPAGP